MNIKSIVFFLLLPLVLFGVVPDRQVSIPMRDGVCLVADFYYPEGVSPKEPLPCVLMRSPAGRHAEPFLSYALKLRDQGFFVVMQETRSAIDAKGRTFPFFTDGWGSLQDGYDTVEWLAKSPYTNGKIATYGFSALGITQVMMAPSNPPSLVCQYIGIAASSLYHHGAYVGGQLLKNQVEGWLHAYAPDPGVIGMLCNQPFYNEFWQELNALEVTHLVKVPAVHYGGWYDTFIQGTLDEFTARQSKGGEGARGTQKLLIGPWTHRYPEVLKHGDFELPKNSYYPPIDLSPKRWFDRYLNGEDNGVEDLPAVTYYLMGPLDGSASRGNKWCFSDTWPIDAHQVKLFLKEGLALSLEQPTREGSISFIHDPKHPVPTLGGCNLFLEAGPKDQRSIEAREDVILFTTEPLEEDLEVTGRLIARIYVSTDCKDVDIALRLTDVYPDGKSVLIADGLARLHTEDRSIHPVDVDLWSTSMVFAKGHRIRVSIAGSNYPRYEINLHRGYLGSCDDFWQKAKVTVHFSKETPSYIELPVVEPLSESTKS